MSKLERLALTVLWISILNLAAFVLIALLIGGDALNGKIESGLYYVGGGSRFTPVSGTVFAYSKWHALVALGGQPIALAFYLFSKTRTISARDS
jgi:hypothetical protein